MIQLLIMPLPAEEFSLFLALEMAPGYQISNVAVFLS